MKTAMNKLWFVTAAVALTIVEVVVSAAFLLLLGVAAIVLGVAHIVGVIRRPSSRSRAGLKPRTQPQPVVVWQRQHAPA